MILPPLQGNLDQPGFFIYAACDQEYFNEFGPALINSIQTNTSYGIHLHLYNPTPEQIKYCRNQDRVTVTFEMVPLELFITASARWLTPPGDKELQLKYKQILNAMRKGHDTSIQHRIQKTYYACARFIRLQQLIRPTTLLFAIDVDAIVRKEWPDLPNTHDFYMHYISGSKARFLAGGLYLTGSNNGYDFLKKYATVLKNNIEKDLLYWGIDQDALDPIVPRYRHGQLPIEYIDWDMRDHSYIWTAKGTRKELEIFVNEKQKYIP